MARSASKVRHQQSARPSLVPVVQVAKVKEGRQKSWHWDSGELSWDEGSELRRAQMTQLGLDLDLTTKRTRKREFLDEDGAVCLG